MAQALVRILLQASLQYAPERLRNSRQIGLRLEYRSQRIGEIFTIEQPLSGDQFIEHRAEGPNICRESTTLPRACSGDM